MSWFFCHCFFGLEEVHVFCYPDMSLCVLRCCSDGKTEAGCGESEEVEIVFDEATMYVARVFLGFGNIAVVKM